MKLSYAEYFHSELQSVVVEPREPQMEFPLHDHDFNELVIVLSGNGWHIVNDDPHFITCGEIFYIDAEDHHEFEKVKDLRLINILYCPNRLSLGADAVRPLLFSTGKADGMSRHWQVTEDVLSQLNPVIDSLVTESKKNDPLSKAMAEALFIQLNVALYRNRFPVDGADFPRPVRLGHVLSYMRHNCMEEVDAEELAERFGYSARNFHKMFRDATGTTPRSYLTKLRINHAMRALLRTDDSITDIAYDSGFNDSNYFSFCFSKLTGVSPSEFRGNARHARVDRGPMM
ncbi:helix-turn-helix domain-containing protein [Telmatospirillum sp.]|uniref:helix-turn-helix domain-containing protein n=1 Tax=Telmatospirillum sp. TaxID=2079197 RepID=UPI00284FDDF4|nr:helix-turn-helix domain-containing protein [Telmatospirillum sp.]MDR3439139.1 helix-turn-helix domain-containing protein [Telmatospirillum sp.]